ncbi:MAG TPA: hypothetical protein VHN74_03740 [Candidatus Angelobacter sp.]|jgi:hypothetical protein|nr:hypothetical protein [Candidatus Angelobacter sp.]
MKTCSRIPGTICAILVVATSAALAGAQNSPSTTATQSPSVPSLPAGTQLVAEFEHKLDVKKLKPGDQVKARLTQDLLLHGRVVAPVESKLIGHVVEAVPSKSKEEDSRLAIVFDKALLKKHQEIALNGIIAAMRPPVPQQSMVDKPDQMMPPFMTSSRGVQSPGRGGSSRGSSASNTTPTNSSVVALGQMGTSPVIQSNPGSNPGSSIGRSRPLNASQGGAATGGIGVAGAQGIPNVAMLPAGPNGSRPSIIIGKKSNLKLESGTQIIVVVAGSPLVQSR